MNLKVIRIIKIKKFISGQSNRPMTISEIHDGIYEALQVDVSRRTIQRDIISMIEDGEIEQINTYPLKYKLKRKDVHTLDFSIEEIKGLISFIESSPQSNRPHSISQILKKLSSVLNSN